MSDASALHDLPDVPPPTLNLKAAAIGLAVVLPLIALLAMGFRSDPHAMDKPLVGKQAPAFALPALSDGREVTFEDLKGKPVVVNFWATWCVPCAQEHPNLLEAARRYGEDVTFVGIVYQDKNEAVEAWLKRHGGSGYETLIDVNAKAAIAYGVYGVPETYFIGPDGVIVDKHVGPIPWPVLEQQVQGLVKGAS